MISYIKQVGGKLLQFGKTQSFQPNLFSLFLNPFFLLRRRLFKSIREHAPRLKGVMLDFGCGRKPYKNLFEVEKYIGVDVVKSGHSHKETEVDIFYDGKHIPVEDEYFDAVFSSEVFEHVFNIEEVLPEIYRVLKKGGMGLVTVPFIWNEHEEPYDFARYTSFGIKYLLEKHKFEVIHQEKLGHFSEVLIQQFISYLYSFFYSGNRLLNTLLTIIFVSPFNILGLIMAGITPKNKKMYHNNVVIFRKVDD